MSSSFRLRRVRSVLVRCLALTAIPVIPAFGLTAAVDCTPPQAALAAWWPGDGDAADISGNADHGILHGNAIATAPGMVGTAFQFYGSGDVVEVPVTAALEPASITVEAWVYPTSPSIGVGYDNEYIVDKQSYGGPYGYLLDVYGGARFLVGNGSSAASAGGPTPPQDQWTHLAGTYDGATLNMYVNGVLTDSVGYHGGPIAHTGLPLAIGANDVAGTAQWLGRIDEPTVYDRALTATEIAAIFHAGAAGKCRNQACSTPPPDLTAWFKGEDDAGDAQGVHSGALHGAGSYAAARVGHGFALDGSSAYVEVPDAADLYPGAGSFSLDAWVRSTGPTGQAQRIVTHYECGGTCPANGGSDYELDLLDDGTLDGYLRDSDGQSQELNGATNLHDGLFHHVAMVRDTLTGQFVLYLDGALEASQPLTVTGSLGDDDGEADPFQIGAIQLIHSDVRVGFFAGVIDEVQYFHRALTAQEIRSIHASGASGQCTAPGCTAGTFDFAAARFSGSEKSGKAVVRIARSGATAGAASVLFSSADGTAVSPADFGAIAGQAVNFADGQALATVTLSGILADGLDEPAETFSLGLHDPSPGACIGPSHPLADVSIGDHDPAPIVSLTTADQTLGEAGAGHFTVTAHLSAARGTNTRILFVYSGSASVNKDYRLRKDGGGKVVNYIDIPAGATSGDLAIDVLDDALDEDDESLAVTINPALTVATPAGTTSNVLTIADDDEMPTLAFASARSNGTEGGGGGASFAAVTVKLSAASARTITVPVVITGGTAAEGGDYTVNGAGAITIAPGKTSGYALTVLDDTLHESAETVTLSLGDPVNAVLGTPSAHTLTIRDNDP